MSTFIFEDYAFDTSTNTAKFRYSFDGERTFEEQVEFAPSAEKYDEALLERALFLSFILVGSSYFKSFPTRSIAFSKSSIDSWQAHFLNSVYQEGMSQFAYENNLTRDDLAHFEANTDTVPEAIPYSGRGILSLQSGGKDSLLAAQLLAEASQDFSVFYISSTSHYPKILNELGKEILLTRRIIDLEAIRQSIREGGLNGHVPVTYIVLSFALIQTVLLNKQTVLTAIGHEGEEPHAWIGDLPVNHQWSKTWPAEQLFAEYVERYISKDIRVGSPLRRYSELRVAELFVERAWEKFGHTFSSCNRANYEQGADNTQLKWCGECSKCANSFLLFAPFVEAEELKNLFNGQDLFAKLSLIETFKGLLGVDGVMKPFECVGEIDELRLAYHMAIKKGGYLELPFSVPSSDFDYHKEYHFQAKLFPE